MRYCCKAQTYISYEFIYWKNTQMLRMARNYLRVFMMLSLGQNFFFPIYDGWRF